jgi:hypothetical protein
MWERLLSEVHYDILFLPIIRLNACTDVRFIFAAFPQSSSYCSPRIPFGLSDSHNYIIDLKLLKQICIFSNLVFLGKGLPYLM